MLSSERMALDSHAGFDHVELPPWTQVNPFGTLKKDDTWILPGDIEGSTTDAKVVKFINTHSPSGVSGKVCSMVRHSKTIDSKHYFVCNAEGAHRDRRRYHQE